MRPKPKAKAKISNAVKAMVKAAIPRRTYGGAGSNHKQKSTLNTAVIKAPRKSQATRGVAPPQEKGSLFKRTESIFGNGDAVIVGSDFLTTIVVTTLNNSPGGVLFGYNFNPSTSTLVQLQQFALLYQKYCALEIEVLYESASPYTTGGNFDILFDADSADLDNVSVDLIRQMSSSPYSNTTSVLNSCRWRYPAGRAAPGKYYINLVPGDSSSATIRQEFQFHFLVAMVTPISGLSADTAVGTLKMCYKVHFFNRQWTAPTVPIGNSSQIGLYRAGVAADAQAFSTTGAVINAAWTTYVNVAIGANGITYGNNIGPLTPAAPSDAIITLRNVGVYLLVCSTYVSLGGTAAAAGGIFLNYIPGSSQSIVVTSQPQNWAAASVENVSMGGTSDTGTYLMWVLINVTATNTIGRFRLTTSGIANSWTYGASSSTYPYGATSFTIVPVSLTGGVTSPARRRDPVQESILARLDMLPPARTDERAPSHAPATIDDLLARIEKSEKNRAADLRAMYVPYDGKVAGCPARVAAVDDDDDYTFGPVDALPSAPGGPRATAAAAAAGRRASSAGASSRSADPGVIIRPAERKG